MKKLHDIRYPGATVDFDKINKWVFVKYAGHEAGTYAINGPTHEIIASQLCAGIAKRANI